MATYSIPKIKQSVFNSSNYIDTGYLTKSEADNLYINELPESVEKLIGNINIVGEETVSSQVVTGNCTINGNLNSGQDGTLGTTATTTTIKGNVNLGDQNNTGTATTALGQVTLGWTQAVNIRGQVAINVETNNGTTSTTIGNGTGLVNINSSNVTLGNDGTTTNASVTQIKGRTIAIGNTPPPGSASSGIQIGAGGLVADAINGQTNTFVSTVNKIFNPKICDAWGNTTSQNFNLNNPSHFVFNQNLKYANNTYTYCETSTAKNIVFYLNTPTLVANQCYTMCFEFFYYLIAGRGVTGGASVTPSTGALNSSYSGTASKVIQSCFMLVLAKASGGDGAYTFSCINTTQSSNPFVAFTHTGAQANTTTTPLGFSKGTTDGRIAITIQFPQMANNTYSTTTDLMISMGASLRLCNSNVNGTDLTGNNRGLYPNHSTDSSGGSAFFSLG